MAAVAGALLTARLGVWQLDRAAQKSALQAQLEAREQLPTIDSLAALAATAEVAQAQQHRPVRMLGRWSRAHTVYLDNRPMNGHAGFYVVTPFVLGDGSAVLVQRGWMARDFHERGRVAAVPTPDGEVVVHGRIAPPPARLYEFSADEGGRIRQNLDLDGFARETGLGLRPLSVLQVDSASTVGDGLLREWPAPSLGMAKNQAYAAQWFALSALMVALYVWYQVVQPRHRARH